MQFGCSDEAGPGRAPGGGSKWLQVVLFEPEIAANTGAIGRTCLALDVRLWLVRPLGFRLDEKNVRRAGLDYWREVDVRVVDDYEAALAQSGATRIWLMTTKATRIHWDANFESGDLLVFGPESRGLPPSILESQESDQRLRIPMRPETRSLNLANAATVVMYEAARQLRTITGF
ncbi:MAG: tRNA (cytidine(34)-2'-O)-methyltransferase [Planctomycetota bacterium]